MLTECWNGRGRGAAGLAASSGGGEERGSWPGLLRRSSGRRGCRIRLAASLGRRTRVSGVQDSTAASKTSVGHNSPEVKSGAIPARHGTKVEARASGSVLGLRWS